MSQRQMVLEEAIKNIISCDYVRCELLYSHKGMESNVLSHTPYFTLTNGYLTVDMNIGLFKSIDISFRQDNFGEPVESYINYDTIRIELSDVSYSTTPKFFIFELKENNVTLKITVDRSKIDEEKVKNAILLYFNPNQS